MRLVREINDLWYTECPDRDFCRKRSSDSMFGFVSHYSDLF